MSERNAKGVGKPSSDPEGSVQSGLGEEDEERQTEGEGHLMEGIEKMPPHVQSVVKTMMGFSSVPVPHPVVSKINEEHIHKFMDYVHQDDENSYNLRRSARWFNLLYLLVAVALFIFLIVFLVPAHTDVLTDILKILVAFAGGFGSGYGLKTYFDRQK